jgi:hypothetical protein
MTPCHRGACVNTPAGCIGQAPHSTTDWITTDHATGTSEILHLLGNVKLSAMDFLFG